MTLRKISRMGHPVLLKPAKPVRDLASGEIQALIDDMIETLKDAGGVGLAAPQVYAPHRLILAMDFDPEDPDREEKLVCLANPTLEPIGNEKEYGIEGCLSIPGIRGFVPRWRRVAYKGNDRYGDAVEGEAEGYFARILQHEVDHLDGILFPMRMTDLRQMAFDDELKNLADYMADQSASDGVNS